MWIIKKFIKKLSKFQKLICLILILGFILLLTIGIPTLARYKNRRAITASVWDGSVATSYKRGSGTEADPFIISNGSELAYFSNQLLNTDYNNTYFALSNDIVLNEGVFKYDSNNKIQYILDSEIYYVDYYSNKYFDNVDMAGPEIGTINIFAPLNGFKGAFNGGSFTIYGLYITDESLDQLALFTNLEGNVSDLYVQNAIIYGGSVTAGVAATTNNSLLHNILFDGYVIGRNTELTKSVSSVPTVPVINIQNTETTSYINLTNNIPFIGSNIISTSITGNYLINGSNETDTTVKIDGVTVSNGSFEINLGTNILDEIPVLTSTTSEGDVTLAFTNLSYNIVYKYAVSGGIVATANNTELTNTVNKAFVYGYSSSGGLVGVTTNSLTINQSYNTGDVNSDYVSGGLVGTIEKSEQDIVISQGYNTGFMNASHVGGIIGIANNNSGLISISKVFNISTTGYSIGTIFNTAINVIDAYFVSEVGAIKDGEVNGYFTLTTTENLKTKNYVINNLGYNEFVSFDDLQNNSQNVWVYEKGSLPLLFIDDLLNPVAYIHVNLYSWNNLSHELSTVKLNSNITFSIEPTNDLTPPKEIYYYISNNTDALTNEEISMISDWNLYNGIVQISNEGFYVIYVKIVDYDDDVIYINTDLLILDLIGPSINIKMDDNTWNNLKSNLDYVYINKDGYITVEAADNLSGISSVKYYITNEVLNAHDLDKLSDSSWTPYFNKILINESGTYIVYVQLTDNYNYATYANTDYIVLGGYTQDSLIIGRNATSYLDEAPYITDKSTIALNISYSNNDNDLIGYTHNLISNILLPQGSKITLIDHVKNKVYEYQIATNEDIYNYNNSCDIGDLNCVKVATYPFTLFKEIGTSSVSKLFTEDSYYDNGVVNENFTIVLDLVNTNILTNYNNVILYMELRDPEGNNVRSTLSSTIKDFNIYSKVNEQTTTASLSLMTNYNGDDIILNSDSTTDISITSGINYKYTNGFKIIDTTYEDKEMGLSIKLVDSDGNIVNKEYLKNLTFKVGEEQYYPEKDNIIRINLKSGVSDVTKVLTINTCSGNNHLAEGTYYFKISNYASYDGYYYEALGDLELSIPVKLLDNRSNVIYGFDVVMDDLKRIINKTEDAVKVPFNILQNGSLSDPRITISLYKKDQLSAYDQNYSIVDLSDYISDDLVLFIDNRYYVSTNPVQNNEFEVNLITSNFENTGYKFVFDLYDGMKKIGTINKYFIVK